MEINKRLKFLRKKLGIKQGVFAERMRIKQGTLSDIENCKSILSDRNIKIICDEFNVNEDWLRTGMGDIFAVRIRLMDELHAIFNDLGPDLQDTLIEYAKGLRDAQKILQPTTSEGIKNHAPDPAAEKGTGTHG
jgi:transcriptional regulator with XRE-family HTH domain